MCPDNILSRDQLRLAVRQTYPDLEPEDAFPLPHWFSQQDEWIGDPLASDNSVYNCIIPLRIYGPLNRADLQDSIQTVMQKHQALRSIVRLVENDLVQIVLPPKPVELEFEDLSGLPASSRESSALEIIRNDARIAFNLTTGPSLRVRLIGLNDSDHIIALTTHLLFCDDWSAGILLKDLTSVYTAIHRGESLPSQKQAFQYGDFARDLSARLQTGALAPQISFWKEILRQDSSFKYIALDAADVNRRVRRAGCETAILPNDLVRSLTLLSQKERASLFMTLLSAFNCLLHRYSGQQTIVFGSCAANRARAEVEELVGRFGNDLVLRTDLSGNPTFREVLSRVREVALTAYSYQEVPFGDLVATLPKRAGPLSNPLFQTMFIFQNAPKEEGIAADLRVERLQIEPETAKYDLNVWVRIRDGLEITLEYDRDLFSPDTMRGVLSHYQDVLESMARSLETRINEVQIPRRTEPAQISAPSPERVQLALAEDEVERKLVALWETAFARGPIAANADFFELGGDSIMASRLFPIMEQTFGLKLPLSTLFKASSVTDIAKIIRGSVSLEIDSSMLVPIQPEGSRPPLFCFHGAGGNVLIYRELSRCLGPNQPLYGLQSQGLDGKKHFIPRIEDMASLYLREIQKIQPHGPYLLAGYCMGGILALETAQQLHLQGERVGMLALFETVNWSNVAPDTFWNTAWHQTQRLFYHARNFLLLSPVHQLKFFRGKFEVLRRRSRVWRGMILSKVTRGQVNRRSGASLLAEVWALNEKATLGYVPKPYAGKITDFRPLRQYSKLTGPELNWERLAHGGYDVVTLPVFPAGMLLEPFVKNLAAKLTVSIDKAIVGLPETPGKHFLPTTLSL